MMWIGRILTALLVLCSPAFAANYYAGPSSSGSADGSDWDNVLALSSIITSSSYRGDTIYIMEGSYGTGIFSSSESGTSIINIIKCGTGDGTCENATGYTSSEHDGQATFNRVQFLTGYWTIDGLVGGGPGSWTSGFGIKIGPPSTCSNTLLIEDTDSANGEADVNVTNVTLRHFETWGTGTTCADVDNILSRQYTDDIVMEYFYIVNSGRVALQSRGNGMTCRYGYWGEHGLYDKTWDVGEHCEAVSAGNPCTKNAYDHTFEYCIFTDGYATGGLLFHGDGLIVHGSVFVNLGTGTAVWEGNGAIAGWGAGGACPITNVYVYNNSFIDVSKTIANGLEVSAITGDFRNNIFYSTSTVQSNPWGFGDMTHSYNYYIDTTGPSETGKQTGTGNPFSNYTSLDFSLTSNSNPGSDVGSPYDVDFLGNSRDTWTRGALEYGGTDSTPPTYSSGTVNGTTVVLNFSESVITTGYDANDCQLSCTTAGTCNLTSPTGSGSSRTFTSDVSVGSGDSCTISCTLATGDITDIALNDMVSFGPSAITVSSGSESDPPVISNMLCNGATCGATLEFGDITLTMDATDASTISGCHADPSPAYYGDMLYSFTENAGTYTLVLSAGTDVSPNNSYTFYRRCQDEYGNYTLSTPAFSFSTDSGVSVTTGGRGSWSATGQGGKYSSSGAGIIGVIE